MFIRLQYIEFTLVANFDYGVHTNPFFHYSIKEHSKHLVHKFHHMVSFCKSLYLHPILQVLSIITYLYPLELAKKIESFTQTCN